MKYTYENVVTDATDMARLIAVIAVAMDITPTAVNVRIVMEQEQKIVLNVTEMVT